MSSAIKNYKKRKAHVAYSDMNKRTKSNAIPMGIKNAILRSMEPKVTNFGLWTEAANTTGAVRNLFAPSQGAAYNNRVGSKLTLKSLQISLSAYGGNANQDINWVILYDKESKGAVPAIADIFGTLGGLGPRNAVTKGRFITLRKGHAVLNASGGGLGTNLCRWEEYIPMKGLKMRFNTGNAGDITDIDSGSLIFACTGSEAAGATDTDIKGIGQVTFYDA